MDLKSLEEIQIQKNYKYPHDVETMRISQATSIYQIPEFSYHSFNFHSIRSYYTQVPK